MSEKALVTVDFNVPSLANMGEAFVEEMAGLDLSFDRVKIPSGGGLAFEVPGDDPESPDLVKELVGIIVDHHPINVYYANPYAGGNTPPDCSGEDGKVGVGTPGGDCATCPLNQWGSDPSGGRGKACQNRRRIYLLREGETLPVLLTLPTTSIKAFGDYLAKRVLTKSKRSYEVITKITLRRATNASGIAYSQAQFAVAGHLDAEKAKQAQEMSESIRAYTRALKVQADDVNYETPPQPIQDVDDGDMPF